MTLAPETNGNVAVKAWEQLGQTTVLDHTHLAKPKHDEKIRFRDVQAQPRKIISSPTWSGLQDEHVSYNAGYTNVHELIPWRTLTDRQQFYQATCHGIRWFPRHLDSSGFNYVDQAPDDRPKNSSQQQ